MPSTVAETIPFDPIGNIALTFSGGGFRAAAFSLGALAYLDQIGSGVDGKEVTSLLHKVSYISSTSGGSFTNALYAAYIHQGRPFADVYDKLLKAMTGQSLLLSVFEVMDDDSQWNQPGNEKQRNFINAFAKVYDSRIFEGETMGVFWNKEHLKKFEVCFNSTEFYRGLSFRFQTAGDNNAYQIMGNRYFHFDAARHIDTIKKLKLADVVAASSCFPGGFEPILYPIDFSYADKTGSLPVDELKAGMILEDYQEKQQTVEKNYGLMDGGITDNQGLYSAMEADKRHRNRKVPTAFDLVIITDVTSYFMKEYEQPLQQEEPTFRKRNLDFFIGKARKIVGYFNSVFMWPVVLLFALLATGISLIIFCDNVYVKTGGGFLSGIALVLLTIILLIKGIGPVKWLRKNNAAIQSEATITSWIAKQSFMSEKMMAGLVHFFRVTKIGVFEQMVKARMASLLSMLFEVNLKQTRRLIYEMFYTDPQWDNRRMPNFIYELSSYNTTSRTNRYNNAVRLGWAATAADKQLLLADCMAINGIAEAARTMGTTLWFDKKDEDKLKKIIATGQFTTCCNLLEYVISLERKNVVLSAEHAAMLSSLKLKLSSDFERFKKEPFYLYDWYEQQIGAT